MAAGNRFLVVVNPRSGNGRSLGMLEKLQGQPTAVLRLSEKHEAGVASTWPIVQTTKDGSWKQQVDMHVRTGRIHSIVVIGGDGTIMDVVSLLYDLKQGLNGRERVALVPNLVFLPGGRGNDFVRGLYGYSNNDGDFWTWLLLRSNWEPRFLDLGSANGKLFVNMASVGYGGEVVEKSVSRDAFWSKTALVYQVEGVLGLLEAPSSRCELKADGATVYNGEFFGAFVGNGKANGSGLFWTPQAVVDDGQLDVIAFPKPNLISMATSLGAVKKKQPPKFKHVTARASEFVFHFDREVAIELDGEFAGRALTYEFKAIPKVLRVWGPVKTG